MKKFLSLLFVSALVCALGAACSEPDEPVMPQTQQDDTATGGMTRATTPTVSGPDNVAIGSNSSFYYSPSSLPSGVTFNGWTVSGGSYTITSGTGNPLRVTFNSTGNYSVVANFIQQGGVPLPVGKGVTAYGIPPTPSSISASVSIVTHPGDYVMFTANVTLDQYTTLEWTEGTGCVPGTGYNYSPTQYYVKSNDFEHYMTLTCRTKRFGLYSPNCLPWVMVPINI